MNWKDIKHPRGGGGTLYTHKIMAYLCEKGYDVTLLTAKFPGAKNREVIDGVKILRFGNRYTVYPQVIFYYLKNMKKKFDLVVDEINYIPWFTPFYVFGTPILAWIHQTGQGLLNLEVGRIQGLFLKNLESITPRIYGKIPTITVSESVKDELVDLGFQSHTIEVINPGIDVSRCKEKIIEKAEYPLILYVGRLTRYKGIQYLIEATKHLHEKMPDVRVSIVGKGDYLEDLIKLRNNLGLKNVVKFHGYVSEREKIRLMQKAHLLVNPSIREGFSIVVIEAAVCGTPALGTDTTGFRDSILNGETGFLIPYGKPQIMANKIIEALEPITWDRLSKNARKWGIKFDWENTLSRFENVIGKTINSYFY